MTFSVRIWQELVKKGNKIFEIMIVNPCDMENHTPRSGASYMLFPGSKIAKARSEMVKCDPDTVLESSIGCGYIGCDRTFFQALKRWDSDYPTEVYFENTEKLHIRPRKNEKCK